jgi:hypothetical protein
MNAELHGKQYTINTKAGGVLELVPVKPKPEGLWRPARNAEYVTVRPDSRDAGTTKHNAFQDVTDAELAFGNCFPSHAIAAKAAPLMARANKIIAAALQADPDAGIQDRERTYSVGFDLDCNAWGSVAMPRTNYCKHQVGFRTLQAADECARILNAEGVK